MSVFSWMENTSWGLYPTQVRSSKPFYRDLWFLSARAALRVLHLLQQDPNIQQYVHTLTWEDMAGDDDGYGIEGPCYPPPAILASLLALVGPTLTWLAVGDNNHMSMLVTLPTLHLTAPGLEHLDIPVLCYNILELNHIGKQKSLCWLKLHYSSV
jgi:hypothetical protein